MQQIIDALVWIGNVVRSFWLPLSVVLGFITDPGGMMSTYACKIIGFIFLFFPSTPPQFRISTLYQSMISGFSTTFPIIGGGILDEVLTTILSLLLIITAVKIYKLIPLKAT